MKVSSKTGGVGASRNVTGNPRPGASQPAATPAAAPVQGDALSVSGNAQTIAAATARLAEVPDVRTEKVEAIKAQMDADAYDPDPEAVADGLLREHMDPESPDLS